MEEKKTIKRLNEFKAPREPYIGILDSKKEVFDLICELNGKLKTPFDTTNLMDEYFKEPAKFTLFFGRIFPENVDATFGIFESCFHSISKDIYVNVIICCGYYNSATAKKLLNFFESLYLRGNYSIYWLYTDPTGDMSYNIDDYMKITGVEIKSI